MSATGTSFSKIKEYGHRFECLGKNEVKCNEPIQYSGSPSPALNNKIRQNPRYFQSIIYLRRQLRMLYIYFFQRLLSEFLLNPYSKGLSKKPKSINPAYRQVGTETAVEKLTAKR
jgi:hypothetical protein